MSSLRITVTEDDHIQGNSNAPVTLVEYGDYQCPFCGQAYPIVKQIQAHFKERLRFVFRNFPLTEMHPMAKPAAVVAEFAATKGLFWKMHDLIYENQALLSQPFLLQLTERLNLPLSELDQAFSDEKIEIKIQRDFIGGVRSGVNGTPTFFINGTRHQGSFEFPILVSAIDEALTQKSL